MPETLPTPPIGQPFPMPGSGAPPPVAPPVAVTPLQPPERGTADWVKWLLISMVFVAALSPVVLIVTNAVMVIGGTHNAGPALPVTAPLPVKHLISDRERVAAYHRLRETQAEAEAAHVLNLPLDPANPDWGTWRRQVSNVKDVILEEQTALMVEALRPYGLGLHDARDVWGFMLDGGRWIIPEVDPIEAIADWYYRSGLRFYLAGGQENFLQAYYELSVAAAFDHQLAGQLAAKVSPVLTAEQRTHAETFASSLRALMLPSLEAFRLNPSKAPVAEAQTPVVETQTEETAAAEAAPVSAINEEPTWIPVAQESKDNHRSLLPASLLRAR